MLASVVFKRIPDPLRLAQGRFLSEERSAADRCPGPECRASISLKPSASLPSSSSRVAGREAIISGLGYRRRNLRKVGNRHRRRPPEVWMKAGMQTDSIPEARAPRFGHTVSCARRLHRDRKTGQACRSGVRQERSGAGQSGPGGESQLIRRAARRALRARSRTKVLREYGPIRPVDTGRRQVRPGLQRCQRLRARLRGSSKASAAVLLSATIWASEEMSRCERPVEKDGVHRQPRRAPIAAARPQ